MDATQLKESLSENDIISLLEHLGASPFKEKNTIRCLTICHGGDSHKLYYYPDSYSFRCYTQCGHNYDIFSLIEQVKGIDFKESLNYIKDYFGYVDNDSNIDYNDKVDMSFFNKFKKKEEECVLPTIEENVMNVYNNEYHLSWIKDFINVSTMRRFGIKLNIIDQQIVIPHRGKDGSLVGVRVRNLKKDLVEQGKKYMPLFKNGKMMNHATGSNLYGLYENMDNIERMKKIIIVESEKAVLQIDSFYNGQGIAVAVSGSSFTNNQLNLIKSLPIEEVIICMDRDWEELGDNMELYQAEKIKKVFRDKMIAYFNVSVVHDFDNLLDINSSPTDRGYDVWYKLWKNRISI